jgi:hypothetical protein
MSSVWAEYEYDVLDIVCDLATIRRVYIILSGELAIAKQLPDGANVKRVTVRMESPSPTSISQFTRLEIIQLVLGISISMIITGFGIVGLVEWIGQQVR